MKKAMSQRGYENHDQRDEDEPGIQDKESEEDDSGCGNRIIADIVVAKHQTRSKKGIAPGHPFGKSNSKRSQGNGKFGQTQTDMRL